jgi:glutathione S-transferase
MNAKARLLGMTDTRYVEPTGLSSRNQSSARDLAESVAPLVEQITGGSVRLRILSNLADLRLARARVRLFLLNFEKELFVHVSTLEERNVKGNEKAIEKARAHIRDRLTQLAPVFLKNKYMLGENVSMLDVAIAPLLWRLDHYGIELSKNAAPLLKYAERIFSRPAYIEALTPSEKVMRK